MSPLDFCIWLQSYAIGKTSITQNQWLTILKKLKDVDGDSSEEPSDPIKPTPHYPGDEWWPNPIYPNYPRPIGPYIEPYYPTPTRPYVVPDFPSPYIVTCSVHQDEKK